MPINRIASRTRGWFVRSLSALVPFAVVFASVACSSSEQASAVTDSLSVICPKTGRRGSVQVARVDPKVEEGGVAFKLLGDGAGPGVVLCRDVLYADGDTLSSLMGEPGSVSERNGFAVIDSTVTQIPAYSHEGVPYVAVRPFARHRRALYLQSEQPMDAIVWPREALRHLKAAGLTEGRAYQTAVREGLVPE